MFQTNALATIPWLFAEAPTTVTGGAPGLFTHVLAVVVYSVVGVLVLGTCFWIMKRMMPFSVTKEIEEDQNIALGIIVGSVIIGMSMIIAAAIL